MMVRQVRRLLKEHSRDSDALKNDIRQQLKRLVSLESQAEIFDLLFHTAYLQLESIEMFLKEMCAELEKSAHLHHPQEVVHLQDFSRNALALLKIYRALEQYQKEKSALSSKQEELFSEKVRLWVRARRVRELFPGIPRGTRAEQ